MFVSVLTLGKHQPKHFKLICSFNPPKVFHPYLKRRKYRGTEVSRNYLKETQQLSGRVQTLALGPKSGTRGSLVPL